MKVTVVLIVVCPLGTVPKIFEKLKDRKNWEQEGELGPYRQQHC